MAQPHGGVLDGWIKSSEGPIQLRPVVVTVLPVLEMLLSLVRMDQPEDQRDLLAQKILNLHERGDVRSVWGVELSHLGEGWFDDLFQPNGRIELINRIKPSDEEDGEVDEFPPWASGDLVSDMLADLTYSLGDFGQAWQVLNTLGLQATSNYLRRTGDLRKGKEQREKDGLKAWFWQHANEFNDDFYGS